MDKGGTIIMSKKVEEDDSKIQPNQKYTEDMIYQVYDFAKLGYSSNRIRNLIGVTCKTWTKWMRVHPEMAKAYKKGKSAYSRTEGSTSFKDYVYGRLSPDLQKYWDALEESEKDGNALVKYESLIKNCGKDSLKRLFLYALVACNFNESEACRKMNIPRVRVLKWIQNDMNFANLINELHIHKGNFFEEALIKLVKEGDSTAIIFANKTFNRNRGYNDKLDLSIETNGNKMDINTLDLDLDTRRSLLEALRKKKQVQAIEMKETSPGNFEESEESHGD